MSPLLLQSPLPHFCRLLLIAAWSDPPSAPAKPLKKICWQVKNEIKKVVYIKQTDAASPFETDDTNSKDE